jgi:hypothetical protein
MTIKYGSVSILHSDEAIEIFPHEVSTKSFREPLSRKCLWMNAVWIVPQESFQAMLQTQVVKRDVQGTCESKHSQRMAACVIVVEDDLYDLVGFQNERVGI